MNKLLIMGIGPSRYGVGRVAHTLIPRAKYNGFGVLYRRPKGPRRQFLQYRKLIDLIADVIMTSMSNLIFSLRVRMLKGAQVIILHPQSIGWNNVLRLCENNSVRFYVMDNSFFCIRSYNHKDNTYQECLDCIGNVQNCDQQCRPFPARYKRETNLRFLEQLSRASQDIMFLVQTEAQAQLLERHFGAIRKRIVGLTTYEFTAYSDNPPTNTSTSQCADYDIVYHGVLQEAKGIKYLLEIAQLLPEYSFLIPEDRESVRSFTNNKNLPDNIQCKRMTWENGLLEHIESCKLVMCPSLWSAPIEGALIKSLLYNGHVAVFNTQYGFHTELPDNTVLRLNSDIRQSAQMVWQYMLHYPSDVQMIRKWTAQYVNSFDIDKIFSAE